MESGILESWNLGILSYNRRICYYQDIIIILMQHIVLFHINLHDTAIEQRKIRSLERDFRIFILFCMR